MKAKFEMVWESQIRSESILSIDRKIKLLLLLNEKQRLKQFNIFTISKLNKKLRKKKMEETSMNKSETERIK